MSINDSQKVLGLVMHQFSSEIYPVVFSEMMKGQLLQKLHEAFPLGFKHGEALCVVNV